MYILNSQKDASINFINDLFPGQAIEARYVRRAPHYLSGYLSVQTGCNQGCKFCHLTATKQTKFRDCTAIEIVSQADILLEYYKTQDKAKYVNWNFMARGEPLTCFALLKGSDNILEHIRKKALNQA